MLDGNRLGDAIVDALKLAGYMPNLTPPTEARARAEWKVIATTILEEIDLNAEINISAGSFNVNPGSFVTAVENESINGQGENDNISLTGVID